MNWGQIKLETLRKMFSGDGANIPSDSATKEYLFGMPQAANEAIQLLATSGKYIIKQIEIVNRPLKNMLGEAYQNRQYINSLSSGKQSQKFTIDGARALYFQVQGHIKYQIFLEGAESVSEDLVRENYTVIKKLLPQNQKAVILFETPTVGNVKNLCAYDTPFDRADDIFPFEEYLQYPLREMAKDFFQIDENEVFFLGEEEPRYIAARDYYQEAGQLFVIPRNRPGVYRINYKAYPEIITQDTEDDYEIPLAREAAAIVPLYMASQLYKDDNNAIATIYRNEFEVAKELLSQKGNVQRNEKFTSLSGW